MKMAWNMKWEADLLLLSLAAVALFYGAALQSFLLENYFLTGYWSLGTIVVASAALQQWREFRARYPLPLRTLRRL